MKVHIISADKYSTTEFRYTKCGIFLRISIRAGVDRIQAEKLAKNWNTTVCKNCSRAISESPLLILPNRGK